MEINIEAADNFCYNNYRVFKNWNVFDKYIHFDSMYFFFKFLRDWDNVVLLSWILCSATHAKLSCRSMKTILIFSLVNLIQKTRHEDYLISS